MILLKVGELAKLVEYGLIPFFIVYLLTVVLIFELILTLIEKFKVRFNVIDILQLLLPFFQ